MGKSPAKWIKTVLFAKKSSRSHSSKGKDSSKALDKKVTAEGKGLPSSTVDSLVISQPLPVNDVRNDSIAQGAPYSSTTDATIIASTEPSNPEKIREEQAAVKAQAAFRGYLARRAFHALQGIIRLQALIRGHLVRRQAVATLYCMQGIVKLQALIRGRQVRFSDIGSAAFGKLSQAKILDARLVNRYGVNMSTQKGCVVTSTNAFVCKLISSKPVALPLQMHFVQEESYSAWYWLERWTHSGFWMPLPQPKKTTELKSQTINGGYAMETESARSKHIVRRNFPSNIDSGPANNVVKRNFKKLTSSPAEPIHEHPQSELEKVKRNLRKISSSITQPSDQVETEVEKPKHSARRATNLASDVAEIQVLDSAEEVKKKSVFLASDSKLEIQNQSKRVPLAKPQGGSTSEPSTETQPLTETTPKSSSEAKQTMDADANEHLEADIPVNGPTSENLPLERQAIVHESVENKKHATLNVEKPSNEDQNLNESQKASKRRASLSAKTEFKDDGTQNTRTLPSYMAATESAKAKLRGLSSPRFSADGIEKNGVARRHSLPSSTNGKLNTLSSQAQRQIHANDRGGTRSDRHDKPIQVEWRR